MDTRWLEDFVSLVEARSFSRAAQHRHITQPAFSRRIQSLEAWAGADLLDRSVFPFRLTAAGETLYTQAIEILRNLHSSRAMIRSLGSAGQDVIEFAIPHTLAFTFFPSWATSLQNAFGSFKSRLMALNVHDAVVRLIEGNCDLLIAYHQTSQPLALDTEHYQMLKLGEEILAPYCSASTASRFSLPGKSAHPIPYLAYASGAYLGQAVDQLLKKASPPAYLSQVYETDMSEALKAMAIEGHGLAFLPLSAVQRDLEQGRLVSAVPEEISDQFRVHLQILAYRTKPSVRSPGKPSAEALWNYLAQKMLPTDS
jgi:DNA-binding transcriptional LysR family regulator